MPFVWNNRPSRFLSQPKKPRAMLDTIFMITWIESGYALWVKDMMSEPCWRKVPSLGCGVQTCTGSQADIYGIKFFIGLCCTTFTWLLEGWWQVLGGPWQARGPWCTGMLALSSSHCLSGFWQTIHVSQDLHHLWPPGLRRRKLHFLAALHP